MDASVFGLIVADVIARPVDLRHPPEAGGLAIIASIALTTGGNVCNTGIALAKLGMKVAACGMVGDDVLGRAVTDRLNEHAVDTACVVATDRAQTSSTIVAVDKSGERCFFHSIGVTPLLDASIFRKCVSIFRQSAWMQIGYFGLLPALTPELPELLREFRAEAPGTRIALDTVNPPAAGELLWPILPLIDLFAPSRTEAKALTGKSRPETMAREFRKHMRDDAIVGIKLDNDGCYLDGPGFTGKVPAYKVEVIDTTGAGDVWFAGLLCGLRKQLPLEQAGRFANRAAADCCTAVGASAGVRSFDDTLSRA
jgi:sugar/nucleoside kinase (ribokinase family)